MSEAKITIAGQELTDRQSEVIRVAIDRWSYEEKIDVGSEDHARVLEIKALIDLARAEVNTEFRPAT
jgi:hypothetical protein